MGLFESARRLAASGAIAFGASCVVVACGGSALVSPGGDDAGHGVKDATVDTGSASSASALIGRAGGVVKLGRASVSFPPGALSRPTLITLSTGSGLVPSRYRALSALYTFDPPGLKLAAPARVILPLNQALPTAAVYWSRSSGPGYDPLATTLSGSEAAAQITHFSTGFVATESTAGDAAASDGSLDATSDGSISDAMSHDVSDGGGKDGSPPADASPPCEGGTFCSGVCVDLSVSASNCGACGHKCVIGGCSGGACTPAALGSNSIGEIAVDSTNVYYTTNDMGGLAIQAPLAGGKATTLGSSLGYPGVIGVTGSTVYWIERGATVYYSHGLFSSPVGGGGWAPVYSGDICYGMAFNSTTLFLTTSSGNVLSMPLAGGAVTTLASGRVNAGTIVADDTNIYWNENTGICACNTVVELPVAGGSIATLTSGWNSIRGLAVDSANVYFTADSNGVLSVPIGGGTTTTLATTSSTPGEITGDSTTLYWTDYAASAVLSMPKGGGAVVTLASGLSKPPRAIAVSSSFVAWGQTDGAFAISK